MAVLRKNTASGVIFDIFNAVLLLFIAFITLYPMLYVFVASISNPMQFIKKEFTLLLLPLGKVQWEAYRYVFMNNMIMIGFSNTFFYLIFGTVISMAVTILGAYVLACKGYLYKKFITFAIMFTMYFSGGLVPYFLLVRDLGWIDTIWSVLVPSAISTYNMIVLRTAFASIPDSLHESATIDGANDFTILLKVHIPLSVPTLSVIGLFYAVGRWNSWFDAMIFLRSRGLYPLQLVLREILITSNAEYLAQQGNSLELTALSELIKYATIIIATIPILLIYPFIQKYFVKGMMIGAIKG